MFKQDYIMRMIEQLAYVLAKIMKQRGTEQGQQIEIIDVLEQGYRITGFNRDTAIKLNYKDLLLFLQLDSPNPVRYIILAELFKNEGDIGITGHETFQQFYANALGLFVEALEIDPRLFCPELRTTIESIIEELMQRGLPVGINEYIERYNSAADRYTDFETSLYAELKNTIRTQHI